MGGARFKELLDAPRGGGWMRARACARTRTHTRTHTCMRHRLSRYLALPADAYERHKEGVVCSEKHREEGGVDEDLGGDHGQLEGGCELFCVPVSLRTHQVGGQDEDSRGQLGQVADRHIECTECVIPGGQHGPAAQEGL